MGGHHRAARRGQRVVRHGGRLQRSSVDPAQHDGRAGTDPGRRDVRGRHRVGTQHHLAESSRGRLGARSDRGRRAAGLDDLPRRERRSRGSQRQRPGQRPRRRRDGARRRGVPVLLSVRPVQGQSRRRLHLRQLPERGVFVSDRPEHVRVPARQLPLRGVAGQRGVVLRAAAGGGGRHRRRRVSGVVGPVWQSVAVRARRRVGDRGDRRRHGEQYRRRG